MIFALLVFSRVGACFMCMPGMSSARVPVNVRLFLALAFSVAIMPIVQPDFNKLVDQPPTLYLLAFIASESLVGAVLGLTAHMFFWALQFMATTIASALGYTGQPSPGILDAGSEGAFANLLSLFLLILFFISDMHMLVLRGLLLSYQSIKPTLIPQPQAALIDYREALATAFLSLARISSPFIVYGIVVNFAVGLVNKLTPLIPIYFISTSAVMFGGLFLLYFMLPQLMEYLGLELNRWITNRF
ncbi:MAG: flagellar biosynthetic protein FliR [Alphaproteobacteria bacterium]|nr:flagellar biosynthetic protein FliR [Alphaproteobacteria bacterium]